jgi:hypothetical protein
LNKKNFLLEKKKKRKKNIKMAPAPSKLLTHAFTKRALQFCKDFGIEQRQGRMAAVGVSGRGGAPPPDIADPYTNGDAVLDLIYKGLAKIDSWNPQAHLGGRGFYVRSRAQKNYHEACIDACLKIIYRTDFTNKMAHIMNRRRLKRIESMIMITAIRRFGKTIVSSFSLFSFFLLGKKKKKGKLIFSL